MALNVLILNQHTGNFGDEAAGVALAGALLRNGRVSSVKVVYNGPGGLPLEDPRIARAEGVELREVGYVALVLYLSLRLMGLPAPLNGPLRRFRSLVRATDLVFVAPSGANIGIYRDWRFLVRVLIAVLEGAHPIFHLNSIGASGSRVFDLLARYVLSRSTLYVREVASRKYLSSIGLESTLGPDTAFALPARLVPIHSDRVVLVPSELGSWHPQHRGLSTEAFLLHDVAHELAGFAAAHQLKVLILPHLGSASEAAFNHRMGNALLGAGLGSDNLEIIDELRDFREYDDLIAGARLVVGGRYHSVVLAAKNARPFVSLSYENKMVEVCQYLGMEEFSVDLRQVTRSGAAVAAALESALEREVQLSESLLSVVGDRLSTSALTPLVDLGMA